MLGHQPKHKTMMMRKKKVMTFKNRLVRDRSQVIMKVIAVPTRRPLLNQRKSMPQNTRGESKKKEKKEAAKKKKGQAKEKSARLAWLAAANAVQTTTAEAATNAATAGAPNPALTNAQAANQTKDPTAYTSSRRRSPGRLRIYHDRKATRRRPSGDGALS
jgi:hypothetical protein